MNYWNCIKHNKIFHKTREFQPEGLNFSCSLASGQNILIFKVVLYERFQYSIPYEYNKFEHNIIIEKLHETYICFGFSPTNLLYRINDNENMY